VGRQGCTRHRDNDTDELAHLLPPAARTSSSGEREVNVFFWLAEQKILASGIVG
jgi:hypothetical protein